MPAPGSVSAALGLFLVVGCAANGGGSEREQEGLPDPVQPFEAAHALVIVFEGEPDTLSFRLAPEWSRRGVGTDTVMAFARADGPDSWTAFGRIEADSLVWGLTRFVGDMGIRLMLRGELTQDGVVGCGGYPHMGYRAGETEVSAAFALVPEGRPEPTLEDVPVELCRSR